MAVSETSICNSALNKLGAGRITSLADDDEKAKLCNDQYSICRDEVLGSHPWNFAIKRVQLATVVGTPAFEFDNAYLLPLDNLRVLTTDVGHAHKFKIENGLLLSNENELKIKYIARITDTSKFDSRFSEALAFRIAADISYAITQSSSLQERMFILYERFLSDARSYDAQEGSAEELIADTWLNERI